MICSSKPVSGEYIAFCNHYKRVGWPKKKCVNPHLQIDFHLEPPHIACTLTFIRALVAFVRLVQLSCSTTCARMYQQPATELQPLEGQGLQAGLPLALRKQHGFCYFWNFWNITESDVILWWKVVGYFFVGGLKRGGLQSS